MRYLFGFLCVCALGVMPLVGCSETTGDGGSGGEGGSGGMAGSGGSAGTGGTAGTGGAGGMPECQSPEDCDDGNDCTGNACTGGMCEYTVVTDGTACDESNECTTGMCASGECDTTPVQDGTACGNDAGTCQQGVCSNVACSEQGIHDAIAAGGGPYTFDCDGPQTVVTAAEILIDKDVTLDGEGNLTVDGKDDHLVFAVNEGVIAELTGFTVTRGRTEFRGGCISNDGTLTLTNSTVTRCTAAENPDPERSNSGGGIANAGSLMLMNSTVSENSAVFWGGGIANSGTLTLTNSTVSNNTVPEHVGFGSHVGGGISNNGGTLTLTNSTISGNTAQEYTAVQNINEGTLTVAGSVIDGTCGSETVVMSIGYNIESPGDTCGFDQTGDQPGVTAEQLNLGPLAENGGPTETHALLPGSVAIDQIPVVDCVDADGEPLTTDQRGLPRPQGGACDVGAFELEVAP